MSTFFGIKIDSIREKWNACDSIRVKREFDSNVIDESEREMKKHCEQKISTLLGIKIDWSDEK
jgi:hypothetical protein